MILTRTTTDILSRLRREVFMESPVFYAKSNPPETLGVHTDKVCKRLEAILSLYGDRFSENEKRLGRLACLYHDLGKVETVFQEIVRGARWSVELPHGFLSGMFLWNDQAVPF